MPSGSHGLLAGNAMHGTCGATGHLHESGVRVYCICTIPVHGPCAGERADMRGPGAMLVRDQSNNVQGWLGRAYRYPFCQRHCGCCLMNSSAANGSPSARPKMPHMCRAVMSSPLAHLPSQEPPGKNGTFHTPCGSSA